MQVYNSLQNNLKLKIVGRCNAVEGIGNHLALVKQ
ncbi:hypothetical protein QF042_004556 [Pedobacter sp. W3I1]|nr:hypothetical protein [Pedobacter sp. W3I1]